MRLAQHQRRVAAGLSGHHQQYNNLFLERDRGKQSAEIQLAEPEFQPPSIEVSQIEAIVLWLDLTTFASR